MNKSTDIVIKINNKTHCFNSDDMEAMRQLPWPERKALIELLEKIKQAEYVKPVKEVFEDDAKFVTNPDSATNSSANLNKKITQNRTPISGYDKKLDPKIKPSDADLDDLMSRFIVEQKQSHQTVPDKSSVYKWLLIVFAVIIGLVLIF